MRSCMVGEGECQTVYVNIGSKKAQVDARTCRQGLFDISRGEFPDIKKKKGIKIHQFSEQLFKLVDLESLLKPQCRTCHTSTLQSAPDPDVRREDTTIQLVL